MINSAVLLCCPKFLHGIQVFRDDLKVVEISSFIQIGILAGMFSINIFGDIFAIRLFVSSELCSSVRHHIPRASVFQLQAITQCSASTHLI